MGGQRTTKRASRRRQQDSSERSRLSREELRRKNEQLSRELERLREQLRERERQIAERDEKIADAEKQIADAEKKIEKLERQLAMRKQNSTTSSKPPSSDGLAGSPRKRGRGHKSKRKPGGQPGHAGRSRELVRSSHEKSLGFIG